MNSIWSSTHADWDPCNNSASSAEDGIVQGLRNWTYFSCIRDADGGSGNWGLTIRESQDEKIITLNKISVEAWCHVKLSIELLLRWWHYALLTVYTLQMVIPSIDQCKLWTQPLPHCHLDRDRHTHSNTSHRLFKATGSIQKAHERTEPTVLLAIATLPIENRRPPLDTPRTSPRSNFNFLAPPRSPPPMPLCQPPPTMRMGKRILLVHIRHTSW